MNGLYFGDNLDVLKQLYKQHPDGVIDLIYIDPPFNSKRNYNILFEDADLEDTKAQKEAFADTWSTVSYIDTLYEIQDIDLSLYHVLHALDKTALTKSAISYLCIMAIRIWYMHKVLKDTGSFYLHCDPTMSHYLKIVCDIIFGEKNFTNEISWKRTTTKSDFRQGALNWPRVRDVILHYRKDIQQPGIFHQPFAPYSQEYIEKIYRYKDEEGRRYTLDKLTAPGSGSRGHPQYTLLGVTRHWVYNKEKMETLIQEGRIIQTTPGTVPRYKRYLDEVKGVAVGDSWTDISAIASQAKERLGYPTQKPEKLLERIIKASGNEGDLVADFCCGCGTTIAVAQKLNRRWLGVDISHLSIKLVMKRLQEKEIHRDRQVDG